MVVKILVCWEDPEEIERASEIRRIIDDALDAEDLHASIRTVNIPPKTFGIIVPTEKTKVILINFDNDIWGRKVNA